MDQQLLSEINNANNLNNDQIRELIAKLNSLLLDARKTIPLDGTINDAVHRARDILEHICVLAIRVQDGRLFERNFVQLRAFYFDYKGDIQQSSKRDFILGLWLLYLLSEGRVSDGTFHTELEKIHDPYNNPYTSFVVELQRNIMEGRYNKVWNASVSAPDPAFVPFLRKLISTTREDLFDCLRESYSSLKVNDAMKLTLFDSNEEEQFRQFIEGKEGISKIENGVIYFKQKKPTSNIEIHPTLLINESLKYADEIERII